MKFRALPALLANVQAFQLASDGTRGKKRNYLEQVLRYFR